MMPGSATMYTYFLLLAFVLLISSLTPPVLGHGSMVKPFSWLDTGGHVGMKPFQSCVAGYELNVTDQPYQGVSCLWFNNFTFIPGDPTLDPSMSSFPQWYPGGWHNLSLAKNPWISPGSAPLHSPCGVGGGNPNGCPEGSSQKIGEACPGGGWSYGPLAQDYYVSPGFLDVITTEWKAGDVVEAAWGMVANHGGGYSYRLCKVPKEGMGALTEECFQQGHLEFSGNMQSIQIGENISSRVEFEAHRTKEGTFPKGSQWTRNPIPNCLYTDEPGPYGAYGLYDPECSIGTQFPVPAPGLFGFAQSPPPEYHSTFDFSIVDQLKVPSHLTPGDYVLSFRWDCEQTYQVWNQCANIKIVL